MIERPGTITTSTTTMLEDGTPGAGQLPLKTKKPYVRIITEKRRESNRRAQRVFREKQKKRLDDLENKITATRLNFDKVTASIMPEPDLSAAGEEPPIPLTANVTANADRGFNANHSNHHSFQQSASVDFNTIFEAKDDVPAPADLLGLTSLLAPLSSQQRSTFTANLPFLARPIRSPDPPLDDESESGASPHSWPMPAKSHTEPYDPPSPSTSPPPQASQAYAPYLAGRLSTTSRRHAYTHQLRALTSSSSPPSSSTSSHWPYFNTLTPGPHSAIKASLALATTLKISRTSYLTDAPSSFPTCFLTMLSSPTWSVDDVAHLPHYTTTYHPAPSLTPPAAAAGAESAVLAKITAAADPHVQARFDQHASIVPPSLRPRPVQYLRAHPSYLDCIVWPAVRERVVHASVRGELDHVEFFLDLMHGGMVCWGACGGADAGAGAGGGAAGGDGASGWRDAVPWSPRSWEARGWFLRKWQWLIGSEEEKEQQARLDDGDDGVWSISRRWWRIRAEQQGLEYADGVEAAEATTTTTTTNTTTTNSSTSTSTSTTFSSCDEDRSAKDWIEGQVQEPAEGAWAFDLAELRKGYVPMVSMRDKRLW